MKKGTGPHTRCDLVVGTYTSTSRISYYMYGLYHTLRSCYGPTQSAHSTCTVRYMYQIINSSHIILPWYSCNYTITHLKELSSFMIPYDVPIVFTPQTPIVNLYNPLNHSCHSVESKLWPLVSELGGGRANWAAGPLVSELGGGRANWDQS